MELSSPAANMDEDLSTMMDDILNGSDLDGESSYTSYVSSNSSEEENLQPCNLKKYYEEAADILHINALASTSRPVLRSLPSDYSSSCTESPTPKRKRQRNPSLWKQNIRRKLRERGKLYTDRNGKERAAAKMGLPCGEKCFYQCAYNFNEQSRAEIHEKYWSLNDADKKCYLLSFVKPSEAKRRRKSSYSVKKDEEGAVNSTRKNHGRSKTSVAKVEEVKAHIRSFPTIDSHYCRSSTSRKYLESHLNVQKMYNLYREKFMEPVTLNIYRNIFNNSFNLSFYPPKY